MQTESDKAPSKWDLSHVGTPLCSAVHHYCVPTLEAKAELEAANAVNGGGVRLEVTHLQASVPDRIGHYAPLTPEGLIARFRGS